MQAGRRKYSVVWKYFTKYNQDYAKCNLCSRDFSYKTTTSNLKKHLRKKHKSIGIDDQDATTGIPTDSECFTVLLQNDGENGNEIEMHEETEITEENNDETGTLSPAREYVKNEPQNRKIEILERRPERKLRIFSSETGKFTTPTASNNASTSRPEDEDEIFTKFLIVELKKLTDPKMKNRCKRDILSIIMEYGTAQDGEAEDIG